MYKNFYSDIEWLDHDSQLPNSLNWERSNQSPVVGESRSFLGPKDIKTLNRKTCWVLFKPGLSSVNKSYIDFPEEFNDFCITKVKVIESTYQVFSVSNPTEKYYLGTLNTWYKCQILDKVYLSDIPKQAPINITQLPNYDEHQFVQRIDCPDHFIVHADNQGYTGIESVFIKRGNEIYLTIHDKYYNNEYESTCYNYKLSQAEIDKLETYKSPYA